MTKRLPTGQRQLERLQDRIESACAAISRLGDWLAKKIIEDSDLTIACAGLTPEVQIAKLSGWGIVTQDFAHRYDALNDALHESLEPLRSHLDDLPRPQITAREFFGKPSGESNAVEALRLRGACRKACSLHLEELDKLQKKVVDLRTLVERAIDGKGDDGSEAHGRLLEDEEVLLWG